ncbi:uncharacterized protein AC631_03411 [Debaryomyces fabryi]|uniref:PH-like domain-containing protein n=1 Tax=Debaryomyces fabryi TaxID=58627 RepID=A0A0V1PX28_9ASCO|nr:uncharacterized protein AC631_03411 [Debaryomyces fabryi]KSA00820.1 hypothetical protein AC631_03411 [Debaryomyces fabryi]CUM52020.1 unnamed protein product [Debaryomyces fabryi]
MLSEILITKLLESENVENSNLIEILGNIKPSKSANTSISSIVRGLFTKNKKLLSLLNTVSIELANNNGNSIQLFKNFVNEFIIWLEEDGMVLFEKYLSLISNPENCLESSSPEGSICFGKPILNCLNYIKFINESLLILRNPFIVDKLSILKERVAELIDSYHEFLEVKYLNNISFSDVKLFCETDKANSVPKSKSFAKVSSFFKIDQIVDRTRNESFFIVQDEQKLANIELMLLNLSGTDYNSLALLSIPTNQDLPRSLMYPPFRINELSIVYMKSLNQILLKSINFSSKHSSNSVSISCEDPRLLYTWYKKLERIFPLEESDSPVSQYFLINANNVSNDIRMSGLGINVLSDCQHKQEIHTNGNISISQSKNGSHSNPVFSGNRHESTTDSYNPASTQKPFNPPFMSKTRKSSSSSIKSIDSTEAIKFQYDRSLNIINENLSKSDCKKDSGMGNVDPTTQYIKPVKRNFVNATDSLLVLENENRPVSSQAEIYFATPDPGDVSKEEGDSYINKPNLSDSYKYQSNHKFSSVPDLSKSEPKNKLYELSSGSAIDITNFGRNHNPSFSVEYGLSGMGALTELGINESSEDITKMEKNSKQKRKSIFSLFKKPSKMQLASTDSIDRKSNMESQLDNPTIKKEITTTEGAINLKGLRIETNIPIDSEDPLSLASDKSFSQTPKSALPSPFALPSSTSMYFFKQYKNGSSATINGQSQENILDQVVDDEEDLIIPQNLKDIINDDKSIDFYISPCSPEAMKISKWKQKYGKWEMITLNQNLFLKIVINYDLNKSWLIAFKEVYDQEYDEVIDKPVLLMDINPKVTSIRQSSALDLQINAVNAITSEKLLIMIRCKSGNMLDAISTNIDNVLGVLAHAGKPHKFASSNVSLSSSIMDIKDKPSNSSTLTSLNSSLNSEAIKQPGQGQLPAAKSMFSLNSADITNSNILSNPDNSKFLLLNQMTIRLQKQLESYNLISNPSSWKILSMYTLSIYMISDNFTNKNYYNLALSGPLEDALDYNWLICEEDKFSRIERIGKAGLLIKATEDEIYMIECRGKKEFKALFEIF